MTVDVAGAAAALQGADNILILTHRRPGRRYRRLRGGAVPRAAAARQDRVYSGESGDHQAVCTADYTLLSDERF